jgi:hypothetical protein
MRWGVAGAALLAALSVAACGGKPDGCQPVSADVAQAVVNGAGGDFKMRPGTGQAIRADSGVYYVAFRVVADGKDEVGVWALDAIDPPGAIRSVDGYAQQFTTWPVLDGANGSQTARDAVACLD